MDSPVRLPTCRRASFHNSLVTTRRSAGGGSDCPHFTDAGMESLAPGLRKAGQDSDPGLSVSACNPILATRPPGTHDICIPCCTPSPLQRQFCGLSCVFPCWRPCGISIGAGCWGYLESPAPPHLDSWFQRGPRWLIFCRSFLEPTVSSVNFRELGGGSTPNQSLRTRALEVHALSGLRQVPSHPDGRFLCGVGIQSLS